MKLKFIINQVINTLIFLSIQSFYRHVADVLVRTIATAHVLLSPVKAKNFWKVYFKLCVHKPNATHVRPWSKKWTKNQNLKRQDRAQLITEFYLSRRTSKSDKKWPSYVHSKLGKNWHCVLSWAKNQPFWSHFLRYGLQICFTIIFVEVNWTQIDHFSRQKATKMVISQNTILPKCQSPKSLLLHFP